MKNSLIGFNNYGITLKKCFTHSSFSNDTVRNRNRKWIVIDVTRMFSFFVSYFLLNPRLKNKRKKNKGGEQF